jgi:hypothetical protein
MNPIGAFLNKGQTPDGDLRWSMLGIPALVGADWAATKAYVNAMPNWVGHADPRYSSTIERLLRRKGVRTISTLRAALEANQPAMMNARAFYSPNNATVAIGDEMESHPSSIAHEAGHVFGPKAYLNPLQRGISSVASGLGAGEALIADNKDDSRHWAEAGTMASLPTLASEIDASTRGANMLKRMGMGLGRFKTFDGIPTYAAEAALPMLAYEGKNQLGGFDHSKSAINHCQRLGLAWVKHANTFSLLRQALKGGEVTTDSARLSPFFRWLNSNPAREKLLHNALDYRIVDPANRLKNTIAGSAVGGTTGAIADPSDHRSFSGELANTAAGASLGGLGGRFGPGLLQRGAGRVITNLAEPRSYDVAGKIDLIKHTPAINLLKSVVKDQPIYKSNINEGMLGNDHYLTERGPYTAREVPYRNMFGLKPRDYQDFYKQDSPTQFSYNPENKDAQKELEFIGNFAKWNWRDTGATAPTLLRDTGAVPGNVVVNPDGSFRDYWDIGLDKGEKITHLSNLLRAGVNSITQPPDVVGNVFQKAAMNHCQRLGLGMIKAADYGWQPSQPEVFDPSTIGNKPIGWMPPSTPAPTWNASVSPPSAAYQAQEAYRRSFPEQTRLLTDMSDWGVARHAYPMSPSFVPPLPGPKTLFSGPRSQFADLGRSTANVVQRGLGPMGLNAARGGLLRRGAESMFMHPKLSLGGMIGAGAVGAAGLGAAAWEGLNKPASYFQDTLLKSPESVAENMRASGITRGLAGAGIGALGGGVAGALTGQHKKRNAIIGALAGGAAGAGIGGYTGADSALRSGMHENADIMDNTANNMNLMGMPIDPAGSAGLRRGARDARDMTLLKLLLK